MYTGFMTMADDVYIKIMTTKYLSWGPILRSHVVWRKSELSRNLSAQMSGLLARAHTPKVALRIKDFAVLYEDRNKNN